MTDTLQSLGTLYTLSAASGTGKTSLVSALIESMENIQVSISYTTRAPRTEEIDGINYHFVDLTTFQSMQKNNQLLESAQIYNNYYGTSKETVNEKLQQGIDVILEIDGQGAEQIRKILPNTIAIFILPPSKNTLKQRLQVRGQDKAEIIEQRMKAAVNEIKQYQKADYLVVNDDFNQALLELKSIVIAHRAKNKPQKHQQLIDNLLS